MTFSQARPGTKARMRKLCLMLAAMLANGCFDVSVGQYRWRTRCTMRSRAGPFPVKQLSMRQAELRAVHALRCSVSLAQCLQGCQLSHWCANHTSRGCHLACSTLGLTLTSSVVVCCNFATIVQMGLAQESDCVATPAGGSWHCGGSLVLG